MQVGTNDVMFNRPLGTRAAIVAGTDPNLAKYVLTVIKFGPAAMVLKSN